MTTETHGKTMAKVWTEVGEKAAEDYEAKPGVMVLTHQNTGARVLVHVHFFWYVREIEGGSEIEMMDGETLPVRESEQYISDLVNATMSSMK